MLSDRTCTCPTTAMPKQDGRRALDLSPWVVGLVLLLTFVAGGAVSAWLRPGSPSCDSSAAGPRLDGCVLVASELDGRDLRGASLRGARLEGVDLVALDFRGADFAGARLAGADLSRAQLQGASFAGSDLAGVHLKVPVFAVPIFDSAMSPKPT